MWITKIATCLPYLTVTLEALHVPVEPGCTGTSSLDVVGAVTTLSQTTALPPGTGKSSAFPVLVHGIHDPVDAGIITDLHMRRINQNDFVIFHGRILVHPVRVEDTQVAKFAANLLLRNRLKIALELNLVNTLVLGLTKYHTTVVRALTSSTTDTATDDNVSLLGLVAKTMGLVSTCGTVHTGDFGSLTVLPRADAEEETEGVTLLVTP
mmetsp:Transcript_34505/g.72648  ORF Transcript_34505/g.72648 Transcript_34505/m.72648 type:complete len:209 (+) Transcript_34505:116-742(+)